MASSLRARSVHLTWLVIAAYVVTLGAGRHSEPFARATHGPPHDCQGQAITSNSLYATNGSDNWTYGTIVRDVVALGTGEDQAVTGAGDDYLCGNEDGDPNLDGGWDRDIINGGSGADNIFGSSGRDDIYAGTGNDHATGDSYNDYVEGNQGQDVVGGYDGDDTVKGSEDSDAVFDGRGADTVQGNAPTTSPGDTLYRCDANNVASGFELLIGPSDVYC